MPSICLQAYAESQGSFRRNILYSLRASFGRLGLLRHSNDVHSVSSVELQACNLTGQQMHMSVSGNDFRQRFPDRSPAMHGCLGVLTEAFSSGKVQAMTFVSQ